jgi:hypothetical protein
VKSLSTEKVVGKNLLFWIIISTFRGIRSGIRIRISNTGFLTKICPNYDKSIKIKNYLKSTGNHCCSTSWKYKMRNRHQRFRLQTECSDFYILDKCTYTIIILSLYIFKIRLAAGVAKAVSFLLQYRYIPSQLVYKWKVLVVLWIRNACVWL